MDGSDARPSRRGFAVGVLGGAGATLILAACRPLAGPDRAGPRDTGPPDDTDADDAADTWASGGTAAMQGGYPDPFADEALTACALTCATTEGPCYARSVERRDISEGFPGLPVRLAIRVVDEACAPVAGAVVDLWHASADGLYSGDDAVPFCTRNDPVAKANRFFRGYQTTDASGRADFDTVVPGWYPGRAVHYHFTIRRGDTAFVTGQLVFDDTLIARIFDAHPDYAARGRPDTWNVDDGIVRDAIPELTLATARMEDGALLAWKTIVIGSEPAAEPCHVGP